MFNWYLKIDRCNNRIFYLIPVSFLNIFIFRINEHQGRPTYQQVPAEAALRQI